jgi:hypothetical protein
MRSRFETVLGNLAYGYVLRVPLLVWLALTALPFVAIPTDAVAGPLLRGLFDITDQSMAGPGEAFVRVAIAFALVTVAALMAGATIWITASLIVADGEERFGLCPVQRSPGLQLLLRLLPLLTALAVVIGALVQSSQVLGAGLSGAVIGTAIFAVVIRLRQNLWQQLPERAGSRASTVFFRPFVWLISKTPQGFTDPVTHEVRLRHLFALVQLFLSVVLYAVLFGLKYQADVIPVLRAIPTLCIVLLLSMLLCWALTAVTFLFDRFRIPALAILAAYGTLVSIFPQGDHFFASIHTDRTEQPVPAPDLLARRNDRVAVVVAATGGGIQASAWAARVLAGIQHDSVSCHSEFDRALVTISAVSGGSAGAMFFVDAYDGTSGALPEMRDIDAEPSVKAAEASSLDEVAFGLAYPDLVWTIAPFLKGLDVQPLSLWNGRNLTADRGTALENAWKRTATLGTATLLSWRDEVARARRPAVMFNATVAETGQRMVLGSTTVARAEAHSPLLDFREEYTDVDLLVATAARLSATFPYVSPPARVKRRGVFENAVHLVDGGYYDNYGTATLVEWLDEALSSGIANPRRIVFIQIRSSPVTGFDAAGGSRGWSFEAFQPLTTMLGVRGTGQLSHSDLHVQLLRNQYGGSLIVPVTFEFPRRLHAETDDVAPPLSWHLTPNDRGRLRDAWTLMRSERIELQHLLNDGDNASCVP